MPEFIANFTLQFCLRYVAVRNPKSSYLLFAAILSLWFWRFGSRVLFILNFLCYLIMTYFYLNFAGTKYVLGSEYIFAVEVMVVVKI